MKIDHLALLDEMISRFGWETAYKLTMECGTAASILDNDYDSHNTWGHVATGPAHGLAGQTKIVRLGRPWPSYIA